MPKHSSSWESLHVQRLMCWCRRMSGTPQVMAAQETIAITADATMRRAARGTMVGSSALGES